MTKKDLIDKINRWFRRFCRLLLPLRSISEMLVFIISVLSLIFIVLRFGTNLNDKWLSWLAGPAIIIFSADRILNLIINLKQFIGKYKIGHILNVALIPALFLPKEGYFVTVLVFCISIMEASSWSVRMFNRKINPGLVLSITFLLLILSGTVLLMAKPSVKPGQTLELIDALFVATSSVCVTGLTPINVPDVLTNHGLLVQMLLIQIGGLGVMTFTSFFALFLMGNTGFYNQMVIKDITNAKSLHKLMSTLITIMGFTFTIEIIGASAVYLSLEKDFDFENTSPLFFCVFHSVSAFCNAGFSTLHTGLGAEDLIKNCHSLYLALSSLIILGGIGYPFLSDIKDSLIYHVRHLGGKIGICAPYHKVHVVSVGTRIVALTTFLLLLSGTVFLCISEWNGAFAGLSVGGKITQAFFNATSPRTAGFASIPLTSFAAPSILIYMILMFIGGASQSTAGGIKVDVFAISLKNIFSMAKGKSKVISHGREISKQTIRKSNSIIILSVCFVVIAFLSMIVIQPDLSKWATLFEVLSALGTVGSSLDLTPHLCSSCKLIIIATMFIGRVGIFNILESCLHTADNTQFFSYPEETLTQI